MGLLHSPVSLTSGDPSDPAPVMRNAEPGESGAPVAPRHAASLDAPPEGMTTGDARAAARTVREHLGTSVSMPLDAIVLGAAAHIASGNDGQQATELIKRVAEIIAALHRGEKLALGPFPRAGGGHPFAPRMLVDSVALIASRIPERPAMMCGATGAVRLTYSQLDRASDTLARQLNGIGAGRGQVVAVVADHGPELAIATLATLKAGAAWSLIDPRLPAETRREMLRSAGPSCVLAAPDEAASLFGLLAAEGATIPVLTLREIGELIDASPREPAPTDRWDSADPEQLACVAFRARPVGRLRRIAITQAIAMGQLAGLQSEHPLTENDAVLLSGPASYDSVLLGMLWPLEAGATVIALPQIAKYNFSELGVMLRERAVTTLHSSPQMVQRILYAADLARTTSLRRVFIASREVAATINARARELTGADAIAIESPLRAAAYRMVSAASWSGATGRHASRKPDSSADARSLGRSDRTIDDLHVASL
ncbi:AMP-binding protein [Lolliginicoccus suaedae]|uniref:AMP-binding protein n=1 Tax=Lolliginicoccus suaedae TaxID=2605429 RepID=UPI0011EE5B86|nr:AMP-binding protein [Lolliginicoccus suaedae]